MDKKLRGKSSKSTVSKYQNVNIINYFTRHKMRGFTMNKYTPVGVDLAKNVFQIHYVDEDTGEIVNKMIKRANLLNYFINKKSCLIGMEACGGSQHWARQLMRMGHRVKIMQSRFVKAFNTGNKNDVADAKAIWLAVQQTDKFVAVKTEDQQSVLVLHRVREQLVKIRTMQVNALRGLLTEFGEVMGKGRASLNRTMPLVLAKLAERLPDMLIQTLREQWAGLAQLDEQIALIEFRLRQWMKETEAVRTISQVPGVGLLTATAAVAAMGDAAAFKSGREFAAWIGLVPRQTGSGGKIKLLGISKRGDTYLRTLLIHGARSVLSHSKERDPWVERLSKKRPPNVVVVALANKMARTIWALLAHDRQYDRSYISVRPI